MTLAIAAAGLVTVPALVFAFECVLGLRPLPSVQLQTEAEPPVIAVLVPAHDEAVGIGATLADLRAHLRPQDLLLVVADNCTDETAERARLEGARVAERHDLGHVGKGHALAFGRAALAEEQPPVVIVVDADCRVSAGGLQRLALEVMISNSVVQAAYLIGSPANSDALVGISSFAFRVRNVVRQRGLARLGAAPLLQGTGMAFPWSIFSAAPLATEDIVEDLNLGISLLHQGHRIAWSEATSVSSAPASRDATIEQRTRWEHGSIASALSNVTKLVRGAFRQRRHDMAVLALDLIVPPLALLVIVTGLSWSLAGILALAGGGVWPVAILSLGLAALTLAVVLAWVAEGRKLLPLTTLLQAPIYVVWKLPIYVRFLTGRQKTWVRTERK